jgi:hypothetical protein
MSMAFAILLYGSGGYANFPLIASVGIAQAITKLGLVSKVAAQHVCSVLDRLRAHRGATAWIGW